MAPVKLEVGSEQSAPSVLGAVKVEREAQRVELLHIFERPDAALEDALAHVELKIEGRRRRVADVLAKIVRELFARLLFQGDHRVIDHLHDVLHRPIPGPPLTGERERSSVESEPTRQCAFARIA